MVGPVIEPLAVLLAARPSPSSLAEPDRAVPSHWPVLSSSRWPLLAVAEPLTPGGAVIEPVAAWPCRARPVLLAVADLAVAVLLAVAEHARARRP